MPPSREALLAALQALVLGTLLFAAVLRWIAVATDAGPFRYQGF